jgi:hypothetical protein
VDVVVSELRADRERLREFREALEDTSRAVIDRVAQSETTVVQRVEATVVQCLEVLSARDELKKLSTELEDSLATACRRAIKLVESGPDGVAKARNVLRTTDPVVFKRLLSLLHDEEDDSRAAAASFPHSTPRLNRPQSSEEAPHVHDVPTSPPSSPSSPPHDERVATGIVGHVTTRGWVNYAIIAECPHGEGLPVPPKPFKPRKTSFEDDPAQCILNDIIATLRHDVKDLPSVWSVRCWCHTSDRVECFDIDKDESGWSGLGGLAATMTSSVLKCFEPGVSLRR